jgi:hypothetical protein
MNRMRRLVAITLVVGLGAAALAQRHEDGEKVRVISVQDIEETGR